VQILSYKLVCMLELDLKFTF